METIITKLFNKISKVSILLTISFILCSEAIASNNLKHYSDSVSFITLTGKIIDKETGKPITFANIVLTGTSIGTVSNADGEFLLKIPKEKHNEQITITHIGYKGNTSDAIKMKNIDNLIVLEPELIPLKEVIIRNEDPIALLKGAIKNIPHNYRTTPAMLTGFYREAIKQNRKYVSVAEAVLDVYKSAYNNDFTNDKVKIIIGRKDQDVKKMDTLLVKLQGGPVTPFYLDVIKNPGDILSDDMFQNYDYTLTGQVSLDNKRCYVVEFNQKKNVNLPLYKGKIYVDIDNLAIVGLEFSMSEYGLPLAGNLFVKKKPLTLKFETLGVDYYIRYTEFNGTWCLNYVRSELKFKCKWKRKLFSSTYSTMLEMAVTDIDTTNINKFKSKETSKITDVFSDEAGAFKNDEYWGDYNIIKPDESIQVAIEKLSKKLKKK
jgi:hypothetical protein